MSQHPFDEHLAAHSVDALDADLAAAIEAHLVTCESCRVMVAELREAAAQLAVTVPLQELPVGMRERVLATALAPDTHHASLRAAGTRDRVPARTFPWILAAASLLLAVGLGAGWLRERAARGDLFAALETAESQLAEQDSLLARNAETLQHVLGPDVMTTTLAATGAAPSMRLFWDRAEGVIVVSARRLTPAPVGQTYQLWGIGADGVPVSLGTFESLTDGSTLAVLTVPSDSRFEVSAVTAEPEGGSPQPTTTPVLVGRWPGVT